MAPMIPSAAAIYTYPNPPGYGDTFFMYAYNGSDNITNGSDYFNLTIPVQDGDFVARYWAGADTITTKIQIYDSLMRKTSSEAVDYSSFKTGMLILPERVYPVNNAIRFDLINVAKVLKGTSVSVNVYASQLVFAGVRRRAAHYSDPEPAGYSYYEEPYNLGQDGSTGTFQLSINKLGATGGVLAAPDTYLLPIRNNDFELRRIELQLQSNQQASQFAIQLYDNYQNKISNVPILSNRFFHLNPTQSSGELNFFPSPPLVYKIGSFLRFDIQSLLMGVAIPQAFNLLFHGVKRIKC